MSDLKTVKREQKKVLLFLMQNTLRPVYTLKTRVSTLKLEGLQHCTMPLRSRNSEKLCGDVPVYFTSNFRDLDL